MRALCTPLTTKPSLFFVCADIPDKAIWFAYFGATAVSIPLGCWACSGTACGPLWWSPERMPTAGQLREKKEKKEAARRVWEAAAEKKGSGTGWFASLCEELNDFTSALSHPPYRWLWIQGFFGCIGGIFQVHDILHQLEYSAGRHSTQRCRSSLSQRSLATCCARHDVHHTDSPPGVHAVQGCFLFFWFQVTVHNRRWPTRRSPLSRQLPEECAGLVAPKR